ncbi:hypothetical protein FHS41_005366 [Streptomyces violarus]|uniref:DDE Tnp4 domain-containing protein n=1 Tax=Streptomyces violarus TaxID=67380 RepID=A0A7W4ZUE4_9ACTN|nr:hypothetical protein [Streptomyces violarus]
MSLLCRVEGGVVGVSGAVAAVEGGRVGRVQGAGPWLTTGIKRKPLKELTLTEKTLNRALSAARTPVERGIARLKSWRTFRRSRCSPNRMTSIAKAILTLERQR